MRIGIECSTLTRYRTGIGFYNYHLVRELAPLVHEEELVLLYNRSLSNLTLPGGLWHVMSGPSKTHIWGQTWLGSLCRKHGIDLLHSPGQCLPFLYDGKTVLTIHDLSAMFYPQHKELQSRMVWNCLVPTMARRADHIITVSDNTRNDVIQHLSLPEEKVTRIYEAAAPEYHPVEDQERLSQFRKDKQLEPGYILAVGTIEPRKNYPFLLQVFARWLERSHPEATLVIVGKPGWLYEETYRTFSALPIRRNVRFEGYVPDNDLMRLYYAAADFSILTPFYEGFWLPGLESLACGTPVIAPRHSSIPEVVGNAGILVDEFEEEAWIEAMDRLWMAQDREEWAQRGIERARQFSWQRTAQETLQLYRSLMNGG